jgi:predicted nucleotidyltransferase
MNINQIKEKLNSSEYDFLRNNEHLGNNIILLTLGGSHAYGTNVETSDLDIRGIAVERPQEIIGLSSFEQFENEVTDTTIYALRKIINLLLNCNPNTIEILGTNPEQIFFINKYGQMLKDNIGLFLSKRAIASFGGYATAQLRRLQNALARDNYPQVEKEKHILGSIKNMLEDLKERYQPFSDEINLYLGKSDKTDFEEEIFIDVNFKHYPLRDFKNIYSDMSNVLRDYSSLNHRNNKKDTEHLNKHAMHLIRLFLMGIEILKGEGVHTYRGKDREFLLNIRNGKYTYDEIFKMVDEYEKEFKYAGNNTSLPSKPDYKKVEELVVEINKEVILNP